MATDVSAPFPAVDLLPGATLTVTLDDAGAKITSLAIHGIQDVPDADGTAPDQFSDPGSPFYFGDVAA
jgi:hypothetical protein